MTQHPLRHFKQETSANQSSSTWDSFLGSLGVIGVLAGVCAGVKEPSSSPSSLPPSKL